MNASTINTMVNSALTSASKYGIAISELQAALRGQDVSTVRVAIMPAVCKYYAVPMVAKQRGEGFRPDSEATNYEAAKKALTRLSQDIVGGKASAEREELEVPEAVLQAARKLVALCAEYEGAGRLLATAIATAKAE
jgi:UDP-N-acetylmuramoylalanine-D-glutamate ligase